MFRFCWNSRPTQRAQWTNWKINSYWNAGTGLWGRNDFVLKPVLVCVEPSRSLHWRQPRGRPRCWKMNQPEAEARMGAWSQLCFWTGFFPFPISCSRRPWSDWVGYPSDKEGFPLLERNRKLTTGFVCKTQNKLGEDDSTSVKYFNICHQRTLPEGQDSYFVSLDLSII